jgi:hypothetical protein
LSGAEGEERAERRFTLRFIFSHRKTFRPSFTAKILSRQSQKQTRPHPEALTEPFGMSVC